MSAEEYLLMHGAGWDILKEKSPKLFESVLTAMQGFAKIHVKEALIAALEVKEVCGDIEVPFSTKTKDAIWESYPLSNIKRKEGE